MIRLFLPKSRNLGAEKSESKISSAAKSLFSPQGVQVSPRSVFEGKMNKLPWFTHDNDAHEDEWSQAIIDRFGTSGYGQWWILVEMFDRHGCGNDWRTSWGFVRKNLRTKLEQCRNILGFFRDSNRILLEESGNNLTISIPKFKERQAKLKSKARPILLQSSHNTPIEGEIEGEGEVEREEEDTTTLAKVKSKSAQPDDNFSRFWAIYPRKLAKGAAKKAWAKLSPSREMLETILAAVERQKKSVDWSKDGGQYIPHPATWLNQERWEDDVRLTELEKKREESKKYFSEVNRNVCAESR